MTLGVALCLVAAYIHAYCDWYAFDMIEHVHPAEGNGWVLVRALAYTPLTGLTVGLAFTLGGMAARAGQRSHL